MSKHLKIHKSLSLILTVFISAILITGCISVDVNSNLKFCRSGDWYADMEVIASSYDITRYGGAYKVDNEIGELVMEWNRMGGQWSWRRTTERDSYTWHISGEGRVSGLFTSTVYGPNSTYESTPYVKIPFLGENVQIVSDYQTGDRLIHIISTPYTGFQIEHYNFSIMGGRIISSNADYVDGNTAHWYLKSYEQIDITLTEGWCWEPYRYWILGGVIAIVLIGLGICCFLIVRKRRQVQSIGTQLEEMQPRPSSRFKIMSAKFYGTVRSMKIRNLLNPALIGVFTWSWIAGGAVAIVAIVQSVYTQCTWLISTFGGVQFLGCSSSTDTTIFVFYLTLECSAVGFAGFMGTFAGKSLKSGAKAGALAMFIPSLAEAISSLINMGSEAFPLSCFSLPLSLIMAVAFGAFIGVVGGWIGLEISRRRKCNEPPVIDELSISSKGRVISNEGVVIQGDKIVIQAKVGDFHKARGIRLYINDRLLQEAHQSKCAFEVDTTRLIPGRYTIRIEAAGINDANWSNITSKQQVLIVSEGGQHE
jgi:MFS family permease